MRHANLFGIFVAFVIAAVFGYLYAKRKFKIKSGGPKGSGGSGGPGPVENEN